MRQRRPDATTWHGVEQGTDGRRQLDKRVASPLGACRQLQQHVSLVVTTELECFSSDWRKLPSLVERSSPAIMLPYT